MSSSYPGFNRDETPEEREARKEAEYRKREEAADRYWRNYQPPGPCDQFDENDDPLPLWFWH